MFKYVYAFLHCRVFEFFFIVLLLGHGLVIQFNQSSMLSVYRLKEDTAWHPAWREEYERNKVLGIALTVGLGPIRPWMSIAHWYVILFYNEAFLIPRN